MKTFFEKHKSVIYIIAVIVLIIALIFFFRRQINNYLSKNKNLIMFPADIALHLNNLNPQYRYVFEDFIKKIIDSGYKPQINSSYRTFARQAELYKQDNRNAKPGFSYHNYGLAIDVQVSKDGKVWGKSTPVTLWNQTGIPQIAKQMGLRWGGTFAGYLDAVHFDFPVKSTTYLYNLAVQQFGADVNNIKGNELIIK